MSLALPHQSKLCYAADSWPLHLPALAAVFDALTADSWPLHLPALAAVFDALTADSWPLHLPALKVPLFAVQTSLHL